MRVKIKPENYLPHYYVYLYLQPNGIVRYVGCGSGERYLKGYGAYKTGPLKDFLKLYGNEIIRLKVRENLTKKEGLRIERAIVMQWGRIIDGGTLLNRTLGGAGTFGAVVSDEAKANMRNAHLGHKQTQVTKDKRSASLRGGKRSIESRTKMSAWQIGRKMSAEARAKMSEKAKARSQSPEAKAELSRRGKRGAMVTWDHNN